VSLKEIPQIKIIISLFTMYRGTRRYLYELLCRLLARMCVYFFSESSVSLSVLKSWHNSRELSHFLFRRPGVLGRIGGSITRSSGSDSDSTDTGNSCSSVYVDEAISVVDP